MNSASNVFNCRCQHGVLNVCYTAGELERYNGSVICAVENWQNEPFISLREAARQQAPWNHFVTNACKCTTGCLNCKFTVYEKILAAAPTATSLHHVPTVQGICFCLNQSNCTNLGCDSRDHIFRSLVIADDDYIIQFTIKQHFSLVLKNNNEEKNGAHDVCGSQN